MKPRGKTMAILSLLVGVLGLLTWQFVPLKAVFAISQLSDPARLETLRERGANARLNKIVYWLDQTRHSSLSPETVIRAAQLYNGTHEPRKSLVRAALLRNLKIADELGLLTAEGRQSLRRGHAALVTKGPYEGDPTEIDHIVPISLAPELGNELANLEMLPKSLNRRKSDRVGQRQLDVAEQFFQAGLLSRESLDRVRAKNTKTGKK